MLYKNKKNVLRGVVAFVFMLTLSLSTALSPLAKAEEAKYTWKTLTSVPVSGRAKRAYVSPDNLKLFILEKDAANNTNLWMSADDGATWRKISPNQTSIEYVSFSADGSKIVMEFSMVSSFAYVSVDGGQSWTENHGSEHPIISPDGSFLASCSGSSATGYTTHISTDDGQTWTRKGTNSVGCPTYVANNGILIAQGNNGDLARSTDYGQTWTETSNVLNYSGISSIASFSNNGNNIFEGDRISLDGGNHWTPSNAPIPAGQTLYQTGISDDGKKLFVAARLVTGGVRKTTLLTSVDGGRTWHSEDDLGDSDTSMSNDGSKLFNVYIENGGFVYRLGTLTTSQPVTPGSGAGGTVTPSTGSTSATLNQKPGKASGRLAETGTSTWMVGGLAVVAVAAGALVLRKRL